MGRPKNSDGFTLPELLIASSLFALVVVAVTTSMRVSLGVDRNTDLKRQASMRLQSAIDSMIQWNTWPALIPCDLTLGGSTDPKIPCQIRSNYVTDAGFGGRPFDVYRYPHIYTIKIFWENDSLGHEIFHHGVP